MTNYLSLRDAAQYLGVKPGTLKSWDRNGVFSPAGRTPGGRRLYTRDQIDRFVAADQIQRREKNTQPVPAAE